MWYNIYLVPNIFIIPKGNLIPIKAVTPHNLLPQSLATTISFSISMDLTLPDTTCGLLNSSPNT